jgi:hypothetical protein
VHVVQAAALRLAADALDGPAGRQNVGQPQFPWPGGT